MQSVKTLSDFTAESQESKCPYMLHQHTTFWITEWIRLAGNGWLRGELNDCRSPSDFSFYRERAWCSYNKGEKMPSKVKIDDFSSIHQRTVDTGQTITPNLERQMDTEDNSQDQNPLQLLLLLPSRFSRVWLCVTPETAAHQASPSLGLSRQEHWSG